MQPLPPEGYSDFNGTEEEPQRIKLYLIDKVNPIICYGYTKDLAFSIRIKLKIDGDSDQIPFENIAKIERYI